MPAGFVPVTLPSLLVIAMSLPVWVAVQLCCVLVISGRLPVLQAQLAVKEQVNPVVALRTLMSPERTQSSGMRLLLKLHSPSGDGAFFSWASAAPARTKT